MAISGILALHLAVPPGYASPIWPPAGVALAALLLWGRAYWPAVMLGAFSLNVWNSLGFGNALASAVYPAIGIAAGSTLQAIVAHWMLKKWGGQTGMLKLDSPRGVLSFFGLAGLLSCLIAPSVGVTTLFVTGMMPTATIPMSWFNWWIGDSLGVMIITPLILCLLAQPKDLWAPRRYTVALPLALILTALVTAFFYVHRAEQSRIQSEFNTLASSIDQSLLERLNSIINGTLSLRSLYLASNEVSRSEFSLFSRNVMERHPEIQVLEWMPHVTASQLPLFEQAVRLEGFKDFRVRERTPDGTLVTVARRETYYPILFLEPMAGNERAFGLDSASNPASRQAKEQSRLTGQPTVSQRLNLVQDGPGQFGILISTPLFKNQQHPAPDSLAGFITGVFHPARVIEHTLKGYRTELLGIALRDLDAPKNAQDLFTFNAQRPLTQGDHLQSWEHTFVFGDRHWQITISPDRNFIGEHASLLPWITLSGGLVFTVMLGFYLLTMSGRTTHIRQLVDQRTHELQQSEARLRFLLETSPVAVRVAKHNGRKVVFANHRYDELIMAAPGQAIGIDPETYYSDPADYKAVLEQLAEGRAIYNQPIQLDIPGKGIRWCLASYLPIQYEGEAAIIGWFYDITERTRAEEKLKLAARVFSDAHEGIIITDASGNIIDINPTFSEITGYSREEMLGKNPSLLSSGKHESEFYGAMWQTLRDHGHWQGEIWNRRKNGELYAELLTISALRDEKGNTLHYIGLFSDITHSKHQQQKLELLAHYDALTHLPNRMLFADRFAQAIARCKRDSNTLLAVCYLDLDGFKQVNDSLGHDTGDRLLVQVAERIKSMLREEDTICRLGGDEFAILLGDIRSLDQCEQALERIHRIIAQPYLLGEQSVTIGASSGVALYPLDDADPDTLLRHADQAMYEAKLAGRNRFHLFDAAHDQQRQQQRIELDTLERALEKGEFHLYYQPKVNMKTGEVFGAEALIRWLHPERGLIPPLEFLPIVEGTRFETTLGNWVIHEALEQLDAWRKSGVELQVSVNISPMHLQEKSFFANLDAALMKYPDIPSSQFEIEVLESSVVEDISAVSEVLNACRNALGVNVALDDFGTGYSSLTHLRRLPANMIKVDQSFVRDMIDDPDDYSIIEGVVGLAHAFRREVIAEGVETPDHGLMLLSMGCFLAQGYAIARPMPADSLQAWISSYLPHPSWIAYAKQPQTPVDISVLQLRIESSQWIKRLEACLQSPQGSSPHWPVMHYDACHCGRWVLRARKEGIFPPELLNRIDEAHQKMHQIGSTLMRQFIDGQLDAVHSKSPELLQAHREIESILDETIKAS